jgi:hypothetical protein
MPVLPDNIERDDLDSITADARVFSGGRRTSLLRRGMVSDPHVRTFLIATDRSGPRSASEKKARNRS